MAEAARSFQVPLAVLYSIGMTETGNRGSLRPFAMNVDGKAVYADSLPNALERFEAARRSGAKLIDVGCMQINHRYHGAHFSSVAEMFDPAHNVAYAARFLQTLRTREKSWTLAVARYNAGPDNNPAQKKYVCAVIENMIAAGFGKWTPAASAFCK